MSSTNLFGEENLRAIPILKDLVPDYKLNVLFLSETLVNARKIEESRFRLGFDCCLGVDRVEKGGGLAVLWRSSCVRSVMN